MEIKRILVIRFRRVGDATISSILCTSLKKSFPEAQIDYVLNENIAPLFKYHPDINKLITFSNDDMSSFSKYIRKVYSTVKGEKYDVIIDTRSTVKTMFFSLFSLRSKFRIGRRKFYNPIIQNYRIDNKFDGIRDNSQLTLSLLEPLEKKYQIEKIPAFKLYYSIEEYDQYREYMISKGIDFSKPIIVCAVTARLEYKVWDKNKMKTILERIINKYDAQLIFNFGDNKEKTASKGLQKLMNNDPHIFTNVEAKNLRELIVLAANSNFFFGNEGGARHISQALYIPSFAIYPPDIPLDNWLPNKSERFQGIELKNIIPDKNKYDKLTYKEKFDLIDVNSVWEKLDPMLEEYL